MKTTPLRFSLALLVTATALSGCNWETTEYDEYAGPKGYVTVCHGYCQITFNNQNACETADGTWFIAGSSNETNADNSDNDADASTAPTEEKPATSGYARCIIPNHKCTAIGATWDNNTNTCLIEDENQCHTFDPHAIWYGRNATALGNGRYIVKYGDKYICGAYDFVSDLKNLDSNFCLQTEIDELTLQLDHNICSASAVNCVGLTLKSDDPEAKNTNIGLCSKCGEGQAECTVDGTSINTQCFDIMNNNERCGGCNIACGAYETCVNGVCVESEGWCDEPCDEANGFTCQQIEKGVYECRCRTDLLDCGNKCYDPSKDESCGITSCEVIPTCDELEGSNCRRNTASTNYSCQCPSGFVANNNAQKCLNPADINTCGATETNQGEKCDEGKQCIKTGDTYSCQAHCKQAGEIYCPDLEEIIINHIKNNDSQKTLKEFGFDEDTKCIMPENTSAGERCGLTTACEANFRIEKCTDGMKCAGDGSSECICQDSNYAYCGIDSNSSSSEKKCINTLGVNNYISNQDNKIIDAINEHCGAKGLCNSDDRYSENWQGEQCRQDQYCNSGICTCKPGSFEYDGRCIKSSMNEFCGATSVTKLGTNCSLFATEYTSNDISTSSKKITTTAKCENASNTDIDNFSCACQDDAIMCDGKCILPDYDIRYCGTESCEAIVKENEINGDLTTYYYQGDCNTLKNSPNTLVTCQKSDSKTECICPGEDKIYLVPEYKDGKLIESYKCTNPKTDSDFCNECINNVNNNNVCQDDGTYSCKTGYSCLNGFCDPLSCTSPLVQCDNLSKCVDLPAYHMDTCTTCLEHWIDGNNDLKDGCEINVLNDNKNCGKKDNECSNGSQCVNGECVCTGSFVRADSCQSWIDQTTTTSTPSSAPLSRAVDDTKCIDSNALHFTYDSQSGNCTCHTNWLHEAGSDGCLINIKNDPYNCGALGNQCSTNVYDAIAVCTDGVCGSTCKTNHTKCSDGYDDYCVDLNSGFPYYYNRKYYIDFCGNCETTCYSPHDTCQSASCCRSSTNETNDEVVTCCNGLTRYRKWHSWGGYYSYICRSQKPGGWETY